MAYTILDFGLRNAHQDVISVINLPNPQFKVVLEAVSQESLRNSLLWIGK